MARSDKDVGLYQKFIVRRADREDRSGYKHENCQYVVLDATHDKNAAPALHAYANAVERDGYTLLASDLRALAVKNEMTVGRRNA